MDVVREIRKKYCPTALLVAIVIALVLILFGYRDLARGLVLGTLFSIINFVLMGMSIQLRMLKTKRSSTIMALFLVLMRFVLLAIPLIVSIYFENYHVITTIAGLFMVQAVMLAEALGKMVISRQI